MAAPARTVAVLVSNPALSSILCMVLAGAPSLRVRPFDSQLALLTYMRMAPVDLLVADFDSTEAPAGVVARAAHTAAALERRHLRVIALASFVDRDMKAASIRAGIDEIVVKPMSPRYLLERVLARLPRQAVRSGPATAVRPQPLHTLVPSDPKVVPLFGPRPPH